MAGGSDFRNVQMNPQQISRMVDAVRWVEQQPRSGDSGNKTIPNILPFIWGRLTNTPGLGGRPEYTFVQQQRGMKFDVGGTPLGADGWIDLPNGIQGYAVDLYAAQFYNRAEVSVNRQQFLQFSSNYNHVPTGTVVQLFPVVYANYDVNGNFNSQRGVNYVFAAPPPNRFFHVSLQSTPITNGSGEVVDFTYSRPVDIYTNTEILNLDGSYIENLTPGIRNSIMGEGQLYISGTTYVWKTTASGGIGAQGLLSINGVTGNVKLISVSTGVKIALVPV